MNSTAQHKVPVELGKSYFKQILNNLLIAYFLSVKKSIKFYNYISLNSF